LKIKKQSQKWIAHILLVINQSGIIKTVTPEVTMHCDDDMIVMEKWKPKKPISAIYFNGEKELYYIKRFLIEQEGREESFISEHPNSQLEIVSTDWKPMAEIVFSKERGKDRKENLEVNIEEFIDIKGVSAQGNQLTKEKVNQINLLESLPYKAPKEVHADELEVVDEKEVPSETNENETDKSSKNSSDLDSDGEGQITLF
jgi:topoisomerase-4 subunit A